MNRIMDFSVSERIFFLPEKVYVFGYTPGQVFVTGIMMTFWTSLFWCDVTMIVATSKKSSMTLAICAWSHLTGFVLYLCLLLIFGVDPDGGSLMKVNLTMIGNQKY